MIVRSKLFGCVVFAGYWAMGVAPLFATEKLKPTEVKQSAKVGDVGAGSTVTIKQIINQRDPEMGKTLEMLDRKDQALGAANKKIQEQQEELEKLRAQATLRVINNAQSPTASVEDKNIRDAFAKGDTRPLENALREQAAVLAKQGHDQLANAAQRERELAALVIDRSVVDAVAALKRAANHEPDNALNWVLLGDAEIITGNLPGALQAYQKGLEIAQRLATRDPDNTEWQRDLSISHNKIGDIRVSQGDLPGALQAYQKNLEIAQRLATRDPDNTQWQRDLSVSHDKIGNIRVLSESRVVRRW